MLEINLQSFIPISLFLRLWQDCKVYYCHWSKNRNFRPPPSIFLAYSLPFHVWRFPWCNNERNFDGFLLTLDKIFLETTLHCPVHYASFGTFWMQIGQLFEPQWVFKDPWEIVHIWAIRTQKVPQEVQGSGLWISRKWFSKIFCLNVKQEAVKNYFIACGL